MYQGQLQVLSLEHRRQGRRFFARECPRRLCLLQARSLDPRSALAAVREDLRTWTLGGTAWPVQGGVFERLRVGFVGCPLKGARPCKPKRVYGGNYAMLCVSRRCPLHPIKSNTGSRGSVRPSGRWTRREGIDEAKVASLIWKPRIGECPVGAIFGFEVFGVKNR